jgi:hypothetical protein
MQRHQSILPLLGSLAVASALAPQSVRAVEPVTVAAADFDFFDTSGEVMDQEREHARRLRALAQSVRAGLDESGRYLLVYGGIQKMSTLIQYGNARVIDEACRAAQVLAADLVNGNLVRQR